MEHVTVREGEFN